MDAIRRLLLGMPFLLMAAASPHAQAQVPAGGEFIVNTHTTNEQIDSAIGRDDRGNFVIVWKSGNLFLKDIRGQRYDRAGARVGAEFVVSTGDALDASVTMAPAGDFVVVWSKPGTNYLEVFAQRYNGNGSLRGAEFEVSTNIGGTNGQAAIDGRGNFVITWSQGDGDGLGVFARRFDAHNAPLGSEFQVSSFTEGYQYRNSPAADAAGNFVIAWTNCFGCGPLETSHVAGATDRGSAVTANARIYDPNGNPVGPEFQINATPGALAPAPMYAPDGTILVVFTNFFDPSGSGVAARRFSGTGTPLGSQFQVNTYTTGSQGPWVDRDSVGNYVVQWTDFLGDGSGHAVKARRYTAGDVARSGEFRVNTHTTGYQTANPFSPAVASDRVGNFAITWQSPQDGDLNGIVARRYGGIHPQALGVDTAGNGVLEPGETVDVVPTWFNVNGAALALGGLLTNMTGPAGATYTINDGVASYGTIANNASGACTDCYTVSVSNPPRRRAVHWDASADETLTPDTQGQAIRRPLHVGASFTDVSTTGPFYPSIETLLHHGITAGCTFGARRTFCPAAPVTREEMAPLLLLAKEGAGYSPVPCTGPPMFADVPASNSFCRWIEELARRGIVTGCGGGNYCPTLSVSREAMAIFVLLTLDPTINPPACSPPNIYPDVPETSPFCRWIEELANRGVVADCGGGNYCPTGDMTREQMSVFISVTFGLTLYGP